MNHTENALPARKTFSLDWVDSYATGLDDFLRRHDASSLAQLVAVSGEAP